MSNNHPLPTLLILKYVLKIYVRLSSARRRRVLRRHGLRLRKTVRKTQRLARLIVPVLADLVAHHIRGRLKDGILIQGALRPNLAKLLEELLRLRLVARVAQVGGAQVLAVTVVTRPDAILLVEQLTHGGVGGGPVETWLCVRWKGGVHIVPQRLVLGFQGAGAQ